jgi:hypothetical protein
VQERGRDVRCPHPVRPRAARCGRAASPKSPAPRAHGEEALERRSVCVRCAGKKRPPPLARGRFSPAQLRHAHGIGALVACLVATNILFVALGDHGDVVGPASSQKTRRDRHRLSPDGQMREPPRRSSMLWTSALLLDKPGRRRDQKAGQQGSPTGRLCRVGQLPR